MGEAYQQHFAFLYDRLMDDMPYDKWQQFVKEAWSRYRLEPRTIVDLACGTGRHAIALAQDGYDVTGIDLSEHMLTVAQEQAELSAMAIQTAGGHIQWLQQDMREWDIARTADCVICLCDGINYLLSEQDVRAVLARTYRGLREGGLFLFDVLTAHQYETYAAGQPYTYDDDDLAYIWYSDWDAEDRIITHDLTIFLREDEASERFLRTNETHRQRAYDQHELTEWLREAGFRQVDSFADFTWQPVSAETGRMFLCAVK